VYITPWQESRSTVDLIRPISGLINHCDLWSSQVQCASINAKQHIRLAPLTIVIQLHALTCPHQRLHRPAIGAIRAGLETQRRVPWWVPQAAAAGPTSIACQAACFETQPWTSPRHALPLFQGGWAAAKQFHFILAPYLWQPIEANRPRVKNVAIVAHIVTILFTQESTQFLALPLMSGRIWDRHGVCGSIAQPQMQRESHICTGKLENIRRGAGETLI